MKSITRQAECVARRENRSCLCSAHLYFGVTNRQVDRIVVFHVLHHSVLTKRHRSRPACPVRLHKLLTVHVSVAASSLIFPFSSTLQIQVSSSIDAFATKSSALQHFSAGRVVTRSQRFHERSLSRRRLRRVHLDVRDPIQNRSCASTSSLPQKPQDHAFSRGAPNRRPGFICAQPSLPPSLAVVGSGRIEDAPVPADDDPPAQSVSPGAPIVGAFCVTFGALPRRTNPVRLMAILSRVSAWRHQCAGLEEVCG